MQAITKYLKSRGFNVVDDEYYNHIALWLKWYAGKVSAFHNYRQFNGKKKISRTRKSLGMAKVVAEDWANLLLNEKVEITTSVSTFTDSIQAVLDANDFRVRGNQLVELAFALGTGAFVEYLDGDEVKIDYIRAGMVFPIAWENGEIKDCAFASEKVVGKEKQIYLNIHRRNESGVYVIENKMFKRNGLNITPIELPEGLLEEVVTGSETPFFQIVRPNIVNNVNLDCPMGVSVYGNAIDQLEGCDLIYDSYCNEFRLGKKRIIVPTTMARTIMEDTGDMTPMFDDSDVEFYALPLGSDAEPKITEINMELRAEAHDRGLDKALALISKKCGLGTDRYKFDASGVTTATEVISQKSDLYQALKKHEIVLESVLVDLVRAIGLLAGNLPPKVDVSVTFDDSIIEDSNAERQRDLLEIGAGIKHRYEYRMRWYGEDEAKAKKMVAEQGDTDPLDLKKE